MPDEIHATPANEQTLDDVLAQYIVNEEAGRLPDQQELLSHHPQFASELREFFSDRDQMQRLVKPLQGNAAPSRPSGPLGKVRYFGDYELLEEVAVGGMGIVYKARQVSLNRIVAVKLILKGTLAREEDVKRFRAEAEAAASLQHPSIVAIHEIGLHEGQHYFSMDFVDGHSLAEVPRERPLSGRQAAEYVREAAEAVHYAHQQGTLHRDLKPSNILIDRHSRVRITDFGLAKRIEGNSDLTLTGQILGTPSYMPPEQASGKRSLISATSDIYSLGAVLYELLTGRPPFRGESPGETLRQVETLDPISPRLLSPTIPRDLETICVKCLEKEPHKRYGTAQLFADDLGRYLRGEPIVARPISRAARVWRWCRRYPVVAGLSAAVTLLVGTVAIISTAASFSLQLQRDTVARQNTAIGQQAEEIQRESNRAHTAEQGAQQRLYQSLLNQARASRFSHRVGQRFDSLDALGEAAKIARDLKMPEECFLELRGAAIACLALPDLRLGKQWSGWPTGSDHLDFDGKLEHYARANKQGAVSIRRVADDKEIAHLPGSGSETFLLFSRDGKFLSVHCSGVLNVWKLVEPEPVMVMNLPAGVAHCSDFSPDSRQFAICHADGAINLYDLATGQLLRRLPPGRLGTHMAFRPDGRQLAVSCNTSVEIRDLDTGKVVHDLKHQIVARCLAWHPDGKTLAVACNDSRISQIDLWDVPARKQMLTLAGLRNGGITLAFNHSGDLLASAGWDGILRLWDPRTGSQLFRTMSAAGIPRFSPDDRLLVGNCRDDKLGLWEVAPCREYRTLVRAPAAGKVVYEAPAIRSDGRLLAVGMHDGVGLWDLASGKEQEFLKIPGSDFVLFEPSGALLTNGTAGLLRLPVPDDPATPGLLRIGPPQKLSVPGSICQIACSHDGRVIAVSQFDGGRVLHVDRPDEPVRLAPHADARYVTVSPDGRWVATGSHTRTAVKIWESRSGKLVKELAADGSRVGFSPDGKWLATSAGGLRLWAVGSWQEGPQIGGWTNAFSPDGKLLAAVDHDVVRLVNPKTGLECARLEDPNQDRPRHMSFSPDGTQLVASNDDSQSIHVWDLRVIREQLAKMGLDWDAPAYSPALTEALTPPPPGASNLATDSHEDVHAQPQMAVQVETATPPNRDAQPHNNLGAALKDKGDLEGAIAQ